jgi:hypothetical protein
VPFFVSFCERNAAVITYRNFERAARHFGFAARALPLKSELNLTHHYGFPGLPRFILFRRVKLHLPSLLH